VLIEDLDQMDELSLEFDCFDVEDHGLKMVEDPDQSVPISSPTLPVAVENVYTMVIAVYL
jgi:hypothetical protein